MIHHSCNNNNAEDNHQIQFNKPKHFAISSSDVGYCFFLLLLVCVSVFLIQTHYYNQECDVCVCLLLAYKDARCVPEKKLVKKIM